MSKILKSVTLGDVKIGGIFRALGKEFVKLDADEHGCLVLAKDIWTRMPFRDGDDPECPNDLRRSEIMPYLGNCLTEFTKNGTPLSTFIPLRIDLQDTTGQNEYGIFEVRIGLLTLRGYGKYWRLIPKVDAPWWLATPYGTPNCSPNNKECRSLQKTSPRQHGNKRSLIQSMAKVHQNAEICNQFLLSRSGM